MRTTHFSAKAEYACIAMLELAAQYGDSQPVRLKAIADAHEIPDRFLVQILLQLKGAGLVVSARGAAGGYLLARSPDLITIADIIHVIDRHDRSDRMDGDRKKPVPKIDNMPQTNAVQAVRALLARCRGGPAAYSRTNHPGGTRAPHQENFALSYNI